MSNATGSVSGTASTAADSVTSTAQGAVDTIERQTEGHPLAAGLIAFGAGWLISSLMPASEKEARAAQQLVETAQGLPARGGGQVGRPGGGPEPQGVRHPAAPRPGPTVGVPVYTSAKPSRDRRHASQWQLPCGRAGSRC